MQNHIFLTEYKLKKKSMHRIQHAIYNKCAIDVKIGKHKLYMVPNIVKNSNT